MMPTLRLSLLSLLMLGSLAGCGQVMVFGHTIGEKSASTEVKADSTPVPQKTTAPSSPSASTATAGTTPPVIHVVKDVTISLSPQASVAMTNDSRLSVDALLAEVKNELRTRKLLDESGSHVTSVAEIAIDDFAMKPTSNVVLFGNIISNGTLTGNLRLRDADGKDSRIFKIDATSKLSIAVSGKDINPLGPLYHRFAVLIGDSLTGTPSKPEDNSSWRPR